MIKLTNAQAAALQSHIVAKLFEDTERTFPLEDAFKITDMIASVNQRFPTYQQAVRKIVDSHGGKLDGENRIKYETPDQAQASMKEIELLASVELEYSGEKIKPSEEWPKLTLAEASILRPFIDNG